MDTQASEQGEKNGLPLEHFHAMATGVGPRVESALLSDLLHRAFGFARSQDDPTEAPIDPTPLAALNAYKHRLHALRSEHAEARLRGIELEEQLAEARLQILRLEANVKHLDGTLQQIFATRFWRVKECCARCWRRVLRWLPNGHALDG